MSQVLLAGFIYLFIGHTQNMLMPLGLEGEVLTTGSPGKPFLAVFEQAFGEVSS